MNLEMRAIATGSVQGVGFRAAARRLALELGLKGFVRNLQDGSVEIVAQGKKEELEELLSALKKRFSAAVEVSFCPIQKIFENFIVL
jgi:acylphosphatase